MTAAQPPLDFAAARSAGIELARQMEHHRKDAGGVGHLLLPLALEVLDHVAGDSVLAMYVLADLIHPDHVPPPGADLNHAAPPRPPTRTRAPHLRAVTATPEGTSL